MQNLAKLLQEEVCNFGKFPIDNPDCPPDPDPCRSSMTLLNVIGGIAAQPTEFWPMLPFALAAATTTLSAVAAPAKLDPDQLAFFEKKIRPVLAEQCYSCHSAKAEKLKGGLYLDSREGWQKGGLSGAALVPGKPAESLLISAVRYEGLEMPPKEQLPADEIALLEKWVAIGAPDPREAPAVKVDPKKLWAWQRLQKPAVPVPG